MRLITLISCFFLVSCNVTNREITTVTTPARLLKVISGQTIEVIIPKLDNRAHRVRIRGINVPKSVSPLEKNQAKIGLQELVASNNLDLELETTESDRYNRLLAHVWQDDLLIAEELAKQGYVLADTKYPHKYSDRIFYSQEYARILGYGLWR